jgi:hypothetical protein
MFVTVDLGLAKDRPKGGIDVLDRPMHIDKADHRPPNGSF